MSAETGEDESTYEDSSRSTAGRSAAASRSVSDVVGVKVVVIAIQVY